MVATAFYIFSFLLVVSALKVISTRNPVHSVFFLILAFFNAAGLFVLLGAEFLAMLLLIVYVGAVAVLFLFVVMMLNINFTALRQGFIRYLPVGILFTILLFGELYLVLRISTLSDMPMVKTVKTTVTELTNTEMIGNILYTDYVFPFQMAGLVLLVAMIGAIVLTNRTRKGVRKQNIYKQTSRRKEDCVELVSIETNKGI